MDVASCTFIIKNRLTYPFGSQVLDHSSYEREKNKKKSAVCGKGQTHRFKKHVDGDFLTFLHRISISWEIYLQIYWEN